jgi:lipopolysaccharide cholinephosphotransferase
MNTSISGKTAKSLYKITFIFDRFCNDYDIPYFAEAGTLLGTIRHKGIIPWDDDVDVGILEKDYKKLQNLKKEIQKYGLRINYEKGFGNLMKISSLKSPNLVKKDSKEGENGWGFPWIDVFWYKKVGKRIEYGEKLWREEWPNNWFNLSNFYPLKPALFGATCINIPNNSVQYLKRNYSKNVLKEGIFYGAHEEGGIDLDEGQKVIVKKFVPAKTFFIPKELLKILDTLNVFQLKYLANGLNIKTSQKKSKLIEQIKINA